MRIRLLSLLALGVLMSGCSEQSNNERNSVSSTESSSSIVESVVESTEEESSTITLERSMTLDEMENFLIGVWEHETQQT